MNRRPTVYDVAARAGVSIATVSRMLRRPDAVRQETRDRVAAAIEDLGYLPSGSARGLAERRTGTVGLYLPGFDAVEELPDEDLLRSDGAALVIDEPAPPPAGGLFFDDVVRGAELEAWRRGFMLMIGIGRGAPDAIVRDMAGRVDGIVVLARSLPDDLIAQLSARLPVVVLAGPPRGDTADHVSVANREAMHALAAHVFPRIERAPVYVAGPLDSPDGAERWEGFSDAARENGLDPEAIEVHRGDFTRDGGYRIGRGIADAARAGRTHLPGAVVAANDQMALGILSAFAERGVQVPRDVLVTGFDGIEQAASASPPLTTVRQPMLDLGRAAIQALDRRLRAPDAAPATVRLGVQVLLRGSTGD